MPFLKLGEADRERLGAPESISIDLGGITNREAIRLRVLGFNTPRQWRTALRGRPLDAEGNSTDSEQAVDFEMDYQAWTALVWLALRRAGIEKDPAELEFDIDALTYEADPEPESGKAEEPAEAPDPSAS